MAFLLEDRPPLILESNVLRDEFKPDFDFKSYHDKIRLRNAHKCLGLLIDEKITLKQNRSRSPKVDQILIDSEGSNKDNTISENEDEMENQNEKSSRSLGSKLHNLENQIMEE